MSSSKKKAEGPPRSKCGRCRNHGVVVPQKGHAKKCPFTLCTCWKCQLITERTRINTLERELRRGSEDQCAGTGPSTPGHHIHPDTSPNTGAPQPDPAVEVCSRPISGAEPRAPGPALAERFDSGSPPAGSSARTAPENTPRGPTPTPAPNPVYWRDYGLVPLPLPLLHRMPSLFPHCSNFLGNMPWSPVPPGLYEGSLSLLMVPPYPPAPPYHPPHVLTPPSSGIVFQPPAPPESQHQKALDKQPSTHPHKEDSPDEHV